MIITIFSGMLLRVEANGMTFYRNCTKGYLDSWQPHKGDILIILDDKSCVCDHHQFCFTVLHSEFDIGHAHFGSDGIPTAFLAVVD